MRHQVYIGDTPIGEPQPSVDAALQFAAEQQLKNVDIRPCRPVFRGDKDAYIAALEQYTAILERR